MLELLDLSKKETFITLRDDEILLKTHSFRKLRDRNIRNKIPFVMVYNNHNYDSYQIWGFNDDLSYHASVEIHDNPQFLYDWFENQKQLLKLYQLINPPKVFILE